MNFLQRISTAFMVDDPPQPQPVPEPPPTPRPPTPEELTLEALKINNDAQLLNATVALDNNAVLKQLILKLECMELRLTNLDKQLETAAAARALINLPPINRHIM